MATLNTKKWWAALRAAKTPEERQAALRYAASQVGPPKWGEPKRISAIRDMVFIEDHENNMAARDWSRRLLPRGPRY